MTIRVIEKSADNAAHLAEYAMIPISFSVTSHLAVHPISSGLDGLRLVEEAIPTPYTKDYDAFDSERPVRWRDTFDLSRWVMVAAYENEHIVGGAVVAWNTPGVDMLEGRHDLAVLWDLRVHTKYRGSGVGHRLFCAAEQWARARDCREIKIETQNVNVPACRFYARQGCVLRTIRYNAYPDLPDEVQLLWYKTFHED